MHGNEICSDPSGVEGPDVAAGFGNFRCGSEHGNDDNFLNWVQKDWN